MLIRPFFFCFTLTILAGCSVKRHTHDRPVGPKVHVSRSERALLDKYGAMVGSDISNIKLYRFIDEWYATPHCMGGKSKRCVDCSGFSAILYGALYDRKISGSSASLFDQCDVVSKRNLAEGDFVFFKINQQKVSHVGIYLANDHFVHASTTKGVIISSLQENYYKKWFVGYGRLK